LDEPPASPAEQVTKGPQTATPVDRKSKLRVSGILLLVVSLVYLGIASRIDALIPLIGGLFCLAASFTKNT
jgi:hypothetical protein